MYKYTYLGPLTSVTLKGFGDVTLMPGRDVVLPESSPYVRRLVVKRLLQPLAPVSDVSPTVAEQAASEPAAKEAAALVPALAPPSNLGSLPALLPEQGDPPNQTAARQGSAKRGQRNEEK